MRHMDTLQINLLFSIYKTMSSFLNEEKLENWNIVIPFI